MFLGLVPILWSTGAGAEVMKRIAAPIVGGLATSFLMELIVYPVLYERWKSRGLSGGMAASISGGSPSACECGSSAAIHFSNQ